MSGVIGIEQELDKIRKAAKFSAVKVHKEGARVVLFALVEASWHSSSSAAYNWRVGTLGTSPIYEDLQNKFPVGDYFESRSAKGDDQAILSVAAFAVEREANNFIDQIIQLTPITIANSLDDIERNYADNARLSAAVIKVESSFPQLEEKVLSRVKSARIR